jgi:hypothetical protein
VADDPQNCEVEMPLPAIVGTDDYRAQVSLHHMKATLDVFRRSLDPGDLTDDVAIFYSAWGPFLQAYTRGRLTKETDRLVALLGIVQIIKKSMNMSFIFGLWKELLQYDILWYRYRQSEYDFEDDWPLPSYERAPSWSWASQDGPVKHALPPYFLSYGEHYTYISTIQYHQDTGQAPGSPDEISKNMHNHRLLVIGPLRRIESRDYSFALNWHRITYRKEISEEDGSLDFLPDGRHIVDRFPGTPLYLLNVCHFNIYNKGLALDKVSDGLYRRIGLFQETVGMNRTKSCRSANRTIMIC